MGTVESVILQAAQQKALMADQLITGKSAHVHACTRSARCMLILLAALQAASLTVATPVQTSRRGAPPTLTHLLLLAVTCMQTDRSNKCSFLVDLLRKGADEVAQGSADAVLSEAALDELGARDPAELAALQAATARGQQVQSRSPQHACCAPATALWWVLIERHLCWCRVPAGWQQQQRLPHLWPRQPRCCAQGSRSRSQTLVVASASACSCRPLRLSWLAPTCLAAGSSRSCTGRPSPRTEPQPSRQCSSLPGQSSAREQLQQHPRSRAAQRQGSLSRCSLRQSAALWPQAHATSSRPPSPSSAQLSPWQRTCRLGQSASAQQDLQALTSPCACQQAGAAGPSRPQVWPRQPACLHQQQQQLLPKTARHATAAHLQPACLHWQLLSSQTASPTAAHLQQHQAWACSWSQRRAQAGTPQSGLQSCPAQPCQLQRGWQLPAPGRQAQHSRYQQQQSLQRDSHAAPPRTWSSSLQLPALTALLRPQLSSPAAAATQAAVQQCSQSSCPRAPLSLHCWRHRQLRHRQPASPLSSPAVNAALTQHHLAVTPKQPSMQRAAVQPTTAASLRQTAL